MRWRLPIRQLVLLVAIALVTGPHLRAQEILDRIAARVENDVILLSEVRELSAYQKLVDGKLTAAEFTKHRDTALAGLKLRRSAASAFAAKVIRSTQIIQDNCQFWPGNTRARRAANHTLFFRKLSFCLGAELRRNLVAATHPHSHAGGAYQKQKQKFACGSGALAGHFALSGLLRGILQQLQRLL